MTTMIMIASGEDAAAGDGHPLDFENHGCGKIKLESALVRAPRSIGCFALHFKEDGAKDNRPILMFECKDERTNVYIHTMSVATLAQALRKAGYIIVRNR